MALARFGGRGEWPELAVFCGKLDDNNSLGVEVTVQPVGTNKQLASSSIAQLGKLLEWCQLRGDIICYIALRG